MCIRDSAPRSGPHPRRGACRDRGRDRRGRAHARLPALPRRGTSARRGGSSREGPRARVDPPTPGAPLTSPPMSAPPGAAAQAAAGRLARLHLGTGLLRLARVELEELAGDGGLDTAGILDLAEARWRTGDLRGAAEAAGAWLDAGAGAAGLEAAGDDLDVDPAGSDEAGGRARALAHALIADGLTVRGRHDDAAVHVATALDALPAGSTGSVVTALDALFAGILPRADAWPRFGPGDAGPEPVSYTHLRAHETVLELVC